MAIYVVQSTEELMSTLSQASGGDTIKLASGTYSSINIRNLDFDGEVLIRSENTNDPAVLTDLLVRDSSGLRFFDLEMEAAAGKNNVFQVFGSNDVHFSNVEVHGPSNIGSGNEVSPFMIRESSNVTVRNSEFYDAWNAIAMLDNNGIRIESNVFHDIRTDGIRGGGVSNLVVKGNVFYDFHPAEGDHPDAIQLWSTNQTEVARHIQIMDNLVFRGDGDPTQGIFIRDTFEELPFENVSITGNTVIGGLYNGIAINGVNSGIVEDNVVLEMEGRRSWIRTNNDENFQVHNNRSTFYVFDERTDSRHTDNHLVAGTDAQIEDAISAWVAEHRAFVDRSEALTDALSEYLEPETDAGSQKNSGTTRFFGTNDFNRLEGTAGNDLIVTLGGNDQIFAGAGNDILVGGTGLDLMSGGEGNDIYYVDYHGDRALERADQGIDEVRTSVSFSLGDHVEKLRLQGDATSGTGNSMDNIIYGNDAANIIRGLEGNDNLQGRGGNDVIYGGTGGDYLYGGDGLDVLHGNTGDDRIFGQGNSDVLYGDAGNDIIRGGHGNDVVHGGYGNDSLHGDEMSDQLFGEAGNDYISGGEGNDILNGGSGIDFLDGGAGRDFLTGGDGADRFRFNEGDFSGATAVNSDRITDFSSAQGDRLDLVRVDAISGGGDDAFHFIGSDDFTGTAGQLRYDQLGGVATIVEGDTDGDGEADFAIRLDGTHNLVQSDFIL